MRRLMLRGLFLAGLMLLFASAARAEDPPYVGWTALLPGLTTEFDPSSENDCRAGRTRCVDAVIREMGRRFDPLAESCDHDSIFALAYLRTTEEFIGVVAEDEPVDPRLANVGASFPALTRAEFDTAVEEYLTEMQTIIARPSKEPPETRSVEIDSLMRRLTRWPSKTGRRE